MMKNRLCTVTACRWGWSCRPVPAIGARRELYNEKWPGILCAGPGKSRIRDYSPLPLSLH